MPVHALQSLEKSPKRAGSWPNFDILETFRQSHIDPKRKKETGGGRGLYKSQEISKSARMCSNNPQENTLFFSVFWGKKTRFTFIIIIY